MGELKRRMLQWALAEDVLRGRMSFIAGPRQIGKTTAIQNFLRDKKDAGHYYNWDTPSVKKRFAADASFFSGELAGQVPRSWVALDEIHKYPKWKNLLKGYYDEWKTKVQFVVTGSARLDLFRRSGDSLVGRYFLFRMLPLGIRETAGAVPAPADWPSGQNLPSIPEAAPQIWDAVENLLRLGGYPEPFASQSDEFGLRWRENHVSLLIQEDLRDLTRIFQLRKLETLLYLLPERIGSPLSLRSLQAPLECAYGSIRSWLEALEKIYLLFALSPWTGRLARSVLKEKKYYFWDWGMAGGSGPRFENFLAVQLQRSVCAWNETGKGVFELRYARTKDGLEADFVVLNRQKPVFLVEAKEQETALSKSLSYFKDKLSAPLAFQVVRKKGFCQQKQPGLFVLGADRFLSLLP